MAKIKAHEDNTKNFLEASDARLNSGIKENNIRQESKLSK
jgi:hypothetical protein